MWLCAHGLCWRASTPKKALNVSASDWLVLLLLVFHHVYCFLSIATAFQVMRPRPTETTTFPKSAEKKHGGWISQRNIRSWVQVCGLYWFSTITRSAKAKGHRGRHHVRKLGVSNRPVCKSGVGCSRRATWQISVCVAGWSESRAVVSLGRLVGFDAARAFA